MQIDNKNLFKVYVHIVPNGKLYFGITKMKINNRWLSGGKGYKECTLFWRAIQKYGWDNIQHIVLLEGLSKEVACECEKYLIAKYDTQNPLNSYNIYAGGDCGTFGLHRVCSKETKQKIGDGNRGKVRTQEQKELLSKVHLGIKKSDETRRKMSEVHLKYYANPDVRKTCSARTLKGWETRRRKSRANRKLLF